jgi:hypothetical protein
MPQQGFSFASVVLSYFLVGGGVFSAMLVMALAGINGEIPGYLMMAGGAFVGGFIAARASRGSTIVEPAIGAIAVIATIVGLAAGTAIGQFLWRVSPGETAKFVALMGGLAAGGAIGGAFLSEKLLGEASLSSGPWILYTAFATFGACLLATVFGSVILAGSGSAETGNADSIAKALLIGIAAGCFVAGIAVGASARSRPLGAAFLGSVFGTAGFAYMISNAATGGAGNSDTIGVVGVFAVGGGIATLIGAVVGWAAIGKKQAG